MMSINFNLEKLEKLKGEYQRALDTNEVFFIFEGQEILTSYAKYLIEYLEMKLG